MDIWKKIDGNSKKGARVQIRQKIFQLNSKKGVILNKDKNDRQHS